MRDPNNKIEVTTKRYQVVLYRHLDGKLHRRKVMHKTNRIVWDKIVNETK